MANLLFINHIPANMTVEDLESMFQRDSLSIQSIVNMDSPVRAIATCPNQSIADRIIDKYNGRIFQGRRLVVEPWIDMDAPPSQKQAISELTDRPCSRSKTSIHFPQYSTSRTREFAREEEGYGKFSLI